MYTDAYRAGLDCGHGGGGEGPAGPASGQGCARADPQRLTTALPRSGHQPHRHGPTLRGGPGVQAHGLPALRHQGRTRRRVPASVRSRRHARSVRPRRPHAPRTTRRRVRPARVHTPVPLHRGGRGTPRPGTPRSPVRARVQDRRRRATHRDRPRSRRPRPGATRRTTGAPSRRRLGPHPGPRQRVLLHRRRHRRRPHRQRHPPAISGAARRRPTPRQALLLSPREAGDPPGCASWAGTSADGRPAPAPGAAARAADRIPG